MTSQTLPTPLRILEVLEPSGGGSGRHFVDLCDGLQRHGHHVHAVYSHVRAEDRFVAELKALPLASVSSVAMSRSPSPSDLAAWRALTRIIASAGQFDIIHGHSSKAGALTRLRLPGRHVPRVYTPHAFRTMDPTLGSRGRAVFGGIESMFGRYFTDALICVSDDEHRHAREELGIPDAILHTIVNGAATPRADDRWGMRTRLGVKDDSLVFGFVGRLSEQKAPERLIAAFQAVAARHRFAELVMIGSGTLEAELRARIVQSGYADRIHLEADIPGADAMQAFDALVMPSRYEAMSYVMLEAAASGLPMILTDVGGASTVVEPDLNGFIVPNQDDTSKLAAAMNKLCFASTYNALKQAAEARKGKFSLDAMVDQTERLYQALARKA